MSIKSTPGLSQLVPLSYSYDLSSSEYVVSAYARMTKKYHSNARLISSSIETAQEAYLEGLKIFKESLTRDPEKKAVADDLASSNLSGVLRAVSNAKDHYESRRASNKISEGLLSFSKRVAYYGTVVDVLVQHHPEYVSLVWGAMKLLFGVS